MSKWLISILIILIYLLFPTSSVFAYPVLNQSACQCPPGYVPGGDVCPNQCIVDTSQNITGLDNSSQAPCINAIPIQSCSGTQQCLQTEIGPRCFDASNASTIQQASSPSPTPTLSSAGISCDPTTGGKGTGGILTAIGCVPTEPKALIQGLLKVILAGAGGIALLIMSIAAIRMITSRGDAEALKQAQGQFYAAITGLLFIIFSIFLLKVIGVNILAIPGFT